MKNRQKYIQIFTTTTKKNDAYKIAKTLVNKKLSACVQITGPIESVYRWHGKIEKSREFLCIIKTKMSFNTKDSISNRKKIEIVISKEKINHSIETKNDYTIGKINNRINSPDYWKTLRFNKG